MGVQRREPLLGYTNRNRQQTGRSVSLVSFSSPTTSPKQVTPGPIRNVAREVSASASGSRLEKCGVTADI